MRNTRTTVFEGCRVPVYMQDTDEWVLAEVLFVKQINGEPLYYVHFIDFNKRLDEWVNENRMDLSGVQLPVLKSSRKTRQNGRFVDEQNGVESTMNDNEVESVILDDSTNVRDALPDGFGEKEVKRRVLSTRNSTRRGRKKLRPSSSEQKGSPVRKKPSEEDVAFKMKNIQCINFGRHYIKPWYFSPYPQELISVPVLYICEFCLTYVPRQSALKRHREKCELYYPPGNEVYRKDDISFFEIDGKRNKRYAQNLCLLAKLFLDHKTLYFDTEPFLFYILTQCDEKGFHLIGYFSKEKESAQDFNVACILVLPPFQKLGYGKVLIEFSYELTKKEGKLGSPEKPLSDLGLLSYCSYWTQAVIKALLSLSCSVSDKTSITLSDICKSTGMKKDDVIFILQRLELLIYDRSNIYIILNDAILNAYHAKIKQRRFTIDPNSFLDRWALPKNFIKR